MLISNTHKFVFIKSRKVGGTSLEKYIIDNHFDPAIDQCTGSVVDNIPWYNLPKTAKGHMSWDSIISMNPDVTDYLKFTIERNPWDKVVSQYYFFRDKICKIRKDMSFGEFVRTKDFPLDSPRYIKANPIIIKWEQLEDLLVLFDEFEFKFDINKFREYNLKSGFRKDKHYSELYSDSDIEIVRKSFSWEIENLEYEFDDRR